MAIDKSIETEAGLPFSKREASRWAGRSTRGRCRPLGDSRPLGVCCQKNGLPFGGQKTRRHFPFSIVHSPSSIVHFLFFFLLSLACAGECRAQGLPLIRNFTADEYGGHNRNYDITIGEDGTVYVANFEGLLYFDRAQWHMIHTPEINRITVVFRDSVNTIWVGGYSFFARLVRHDNGTLAMQPVSKKGQFKGEVVEIYEEDGAVHFLATDNNIYKAVYRDGTDEPEVTLEEHTDVNLNDGLESEIVSLEALRGGQKNIVLDDITQTLPIDGGLQVKVKKNHGLIIADSHGRDLYAITEEHGLCSNQVAYIDYDGHGLLWGVTSHGIFAIEMPSLYSYFLSKDGLAGEVHAITSFDGKIFVGATNGLFAIADRQCRRVAEINNICWMFSESRQGLLAATSSGTYRIARGGAVTRLTDDATTAIFVQGDKVYTGEPDGVWCYQAGQRTAVNNLPLVTEMRLDGRGQLWFRNVHGETIGTEPERERQPMEDLTQRLLKPVADIDVKAQYRHGSQIWLGGDEVLAIIDTAQKELADLPMDRRIRFRSIIMAGDSILWGGYGDQPERLPQLANDQGHLHFFYALDHAPLSGQTLYRYQLNNGAWSTWTEKQDIEFLNLSPGSFRLSVQAMLANGELSEVASIDFSIAYPLLMRWYMVVLYLILLAFLLYQLFRYRLKRLQKDKIKLERIVEERTADLRSAQHELIRQEKMATVGKLTEGLIDRILNPMNYIINFSKMSNDLLKDLKENIEKNKEQIDEDDYEDTLDVLGMLSENLQNVDQYGQNTTRTLKAMEEMLKDRTGGYLEMDWLPVLQQNVQMLDNYFAQEKEQYHIQTLVRLPETPLPLHGNPDMLSKTVMSLLGNAVYAVVKKAQRTDFQPQVNMTVETVGEQYVLKIKDNGIGIEDTIIDKIFDPFFTTKTTGEAAGVGLYLSREIVQNHGGDIKVASVKDQYTEFTITLPKNKVK